MAAAIKNTIRNSMNVIEGLIDPFFIADENLVVQYINKPALAFLGYTEDEVIDKMKCSEICKTPLCNTEKCTLKTCFQTKENISGNTIARTRQGERVPVRAQCNVILNKKGIPIGGFEYISDARTLDEGFLNNMADAAFRTDKDLIVQNINESALKALGYTAEEVIGKMNCGDLCKTPQCNTANCTIKRSMAEKDTVVVTTVAQTKTGEMLPVRASCSFLEDSSGKISGGFEIISPITQLDEGFLNNMADPAFRTDKDLIVQNINDAALKAMGYTREEVVGKMSCADLCRTPVCGTSDCTIKNCIRTGETIIAETIAKTRDGSPLPVRASCGALYDPKGNPSGGFEVISDNSALVDMVERMEEIAKGDLTSEVKEEYLGMDNAVGNLARSFKSMQDALEEIVTNIKTIAGAVSSGSQQISSTSEEMSQGATEQASSAEEVSSSMEQMGANISQNAENATQTEAIAKRAAEGAKSGGEAVAKTVDAMKDIASKISIIEEIARQTNLLALNAAIEAARAGEHGKGFAVVASEVRKLAENSGNAAAEIGELSKTNVEIAENAGKLLDEIVPNILKTADLVQEISAASNEQKSGADQINSAIMQLDQVIQQNASASEEMASMAEELSSQAENMQDSVQLFKTKSEISLDAHQGKPGLKQPGESIGKLMKQTSEKQKFARGITLSQQKVTSIGTEEEEADGEFEEF